MDEKEFLQKAAEFNVSKIAREAIIRSLEDLVPTLDISPKEVEDIKDEIYETVLFVAKNYTGRYDSVPNIYLAERIRDCLPYGLSRAVEQEMLHIADVIESVRRIRKR